MENVKEKPCDFMILITRHQSNPKANFLNGSEKFLYLKTHLFPNFIVAFAVIFQKSEIFVSSI